MPKTYFSVRCDYIKIKRFRESSPGVICRNHLKHLNYQYNNVYMYILYIYVPIYIIINTESS